MTIEKKPLFLENEDWYYIDENDDIYGYKLKDNVPEEVKKSYEEFYKTINSVIKI